MDIEQTLRSFGVKWLRTVRTYGVAKMAKTLKEAMRTAERGLKVIIADGECQLARQRRVRAEDAEKLKRGERVVRTQFGVDDDICTGDHSCIRLSGCPSLTVKPNPDPLRTDPVATVIESCVGCGLCGEVAHAAVLCPSFYRAEVIRNPNWWDRTLHRVRRAIAGWLGSSLAREGVHGGGMQLRRPLNPPPQGEGAACSGESDRDQRPITILIAALGGEGGGVLTDWIVGRGRAAAAFRCSRPRSPASRSAPAPPPTTSRSCRCPRRELGGRRPVLALAPGVGDVDLVVASELLEAGRAIASGFVTPDRTLMIASTSRFYRDGREDRDGRRPLRHARGWRKAIEEHAQRAPAVRHGGARAGAAAR